LDVLSPLLPNLGFLETTKDDNIIKHKGIAKRLASFEWFDSQYKR